jgi:hypothetical protein
MYRFKLLVDTLFGIAFVELTPQAGENIFG